MKKKKFVLDIPDLAFSSDLFFERNQLEDKEEEFFFLKRKQRVFVCFVTDHCWNNANASFFSSKWSMMTTTMVTSQMILKNVSAGNRRDSFIKDIFKKKKNQLEQQKSPWKRKNYPNLPSQNSFRSLQEIIQNGVLTLCFLCFNLLLLPLLSLVKRERSRLYERW